MTIRPRTEADLAEIIKTARTPLQVRGGGTRPIGNPVDGDILDMSGLSGITLYEPGALTLVAAAGTPLAEIEAMLKSENQMLAFEPMDHRVLLGTQGQPTIGGIVAANVSGSRRIAQSGACRDSLLGVRFVDGAGRRLKNGGRVMKNVTGYDLVKLMAGSYGTLGVITEVSLKVLPRPETSATLILQHTSLEQSVAAMTRALRSPYEVSGAAAVLNETFLRIEGMEQSVAYRSAQLREILGKFGEVSTLDHTQSTRKWEDLTNVRCFADHTALTRVSIRPTMAPEFANRFWQTLPADLALDWGGGLLWFGMDGDAGRTVKVQSDPVTNSQDDSFAMIHLELQRMSALSGGHATLIKGTERLRRKVPVFQPQSEPLSRLSAGLRAKFDPRNILNPRLMG